MKPNAIVIAVGLAAAALFATGCGDGDSMNHGPAGPASDDASHRTLESRESAHHQTALTETNAIALRAETARYAADMDSLLDGMIEMCEQMDGDSMMVGMMEPMHETMSEMRGSVHSHHARMDTISSLESMRAECEEHHEAMMRMMGSMGGEMGDHGMYGDERPDDGSPQDGGHDEHH